MYHYLKKNLKNFLVFTQSGEYYEYREELLYQSFSSKDVIRWLTEKDYQSSYSIIIYTADKEDIKEVFCDSKRSYFVDKKFPEFKQLVGKLKYHFTTGETTIRYPYIKK